MLARIAILFLLAIGFFAEARGVTIAWSPVGDAGNAADPADGDAFTAGVQHFGAVAYNYRIGTYEVTNRQYIEFLNAKDALGSNTLELWHGEMSGTWPVPGGINFSAANPVGGKYTLVAGHEDHPVTFVTWYDSIRFANWVNNGQGNGDTETGAYTLGTLGAHAVPVSPPATHNADAKIWLPTEDEWYKAAFYDPTTHSYFAYPTSSNTTPVASAPTALANHANYGNAVGTYTNVGTYSGTTSPFGAFDMGGNADEWNENLISEGLRAGRGGNYSGNANTMRSFDHGMADADQMPLVIGTIGFRLAMVPEPSSLALAAVGLAAMAYYAGRMRRRKNA